MRATSKGRLFSHTAKEYARRTSIHGIAYVFDKELGFVDRFIWMVFVLVFLSLATILRGLIGPLYVLIWIGRNSCTTLNLNDGQNIAPFTTLYILYYTVRIYNAY